MMALMRHSQSGRRAAAPWIVLGYLGLSGFLVLEATARQGDESSALDISDDAGTTRGIEAAYALGIAAPLLGAVPAPRLGRAAAIVGLGLQATGLGLRAWSMRVLGSAYTRTLRAGEGQQVVDAGPYAAVRHPGYLGSLLVWLGFALTSRHPVVLAAVGAILGRAYLRRIAAEERLLARELRGYQRYAERTSRLIPLVW